MKIVIKNNFKKYIHMYIYAHIYTHKVEKNTCKILEMLEWYYSYLSLQYSIIYYHRITNSSFVP